MKGVYNMIVMSFFVVGMSLLISVSGHGMVIDPVNRASRWREHEDAPINFDDNGLFCGGREIQWTQNNGKCGLCGDDYADPVPRTYELGGKFGQGVIVRNYSSGGMLEVDALITANHLGYFTFAMCNLDKFGFESEDCFDDLQLPLVSGEYKFIIGSDVGHYYPVLQLPKDLKCEHCVLQWTYTAGNSWGLCDNGMGAVGCGAQETFRTCSDISIY